MVKADGFSCCFGRRSVRRFLTFYHPPAVEKLAEEEPEAYFANAGYDGNPLRVPTDLDDSLCRYPDLSGANRSKFDRAAFWMDIASRHWTSSVSSSFASLVTAIESLTDRGITHRVYCQQCQADRSHEVPGATERFRSFFETYAPGAGLRVRPGTSSRIA
jgi:hypothetical protein